MTEPTDFRLAPGTVVYTVLRSKSRSGASFLIDLFVPNGGGLRPVGKHVSKLLGLPWEEAGLRTNLSPVRLVETVSQAMFSRPDYLQNVPL